MNIEIYLQLRIKKSLRDSRQKIRKENSLFLRFISMFFYRVVAIKVIQIEISPMYDSSPIMFGVNISTDFCDANNAWKKTVLQYLNLTRFKNKFCWIIKIITKDVQSNWSLNFFATYSSSLTFQHNYFNYSRKLFSDMYLSKFLDTLAKLFFFMSKCSSAVIQMFPRFHIYVIYWRVAHSFHQIKNSTK